MISNNRNLLSRRQFLASLPVLPSLLFGSDSVKGNQPKFQIGDYVEFRFYKEEAGEDGYERGTVVGLMAGSLDGVDIEEWNYRFIVEEHYPRYNCLGTIGEAYESELVKVKPPSANSLSGRVF